MSLLPEEIDPASIAARARAHAGLFSLPLKDRNWSGSSGDYAGVGVGSSLDFQDHRTYVPGDDPRHINWQAYARTGSYTLKLYREEVRPIIEILFDVSASMLADPDKAFRTLELFYFLYAFGEKSGSTTAAFLVKGDRWLPVEAAAVFTHRWIDLAETLPETAASVPPNLSAIPVRSRSLRVLLSDLLFPDSPEATLQTLLRNSGRGVVLCPHAASESNPDWLGNFEFLDTESKSRHERKVDPGLLRKYLETYRRHFERWKTASIRAHVPLARISAEGKFETAVKAEAISAGALTLS